MAKTFQWRQILENHLEFYRNHREYLHDHAETEFLKAIRLALETIDSQEEQLKEMPVLQKLFADLCIDNELLAIAKEEGRKEEKKACMADVCGDCERGVPLEYIEKDEEYVHLRGREGYDTIVHCEASAIRHREDTARREGK